jgi:hypothetical protein
MAGNGLIAKSYAATVRNGIKIDYFYILNITEKQIYYGFRDNRC